MSFATSASSPTCVGQAPRARMVISSASEDKRFTLFSIVMEENTDFISDDFSMLDICFPKKRILRSRRWSNANQMGDPPIKLRAHPANDDDVLCALEQTVPAAMLDDA